MTVRAVLYEEEQAVAVAVRLRDSRFAAAVERERLAGEDDDEDHPWTVVTDAPLDLPDEPRRVKGHFRRS